MRVTHGDIIFIDVPNDQTQLADNYKWSLEQWIKDNNLQNVKIVMNSWLGAEKFDVRIFSAEDPVERVLLGQ